MRNTQDWIEKGKEVLAPTYNPPPIVIERGEGVHIYDLEGRKYLDFTSGIGVNALGHAHPEVVSAIVKQAGLYAHTANILYHRGHIELGEKLINLSFADRVFLSNSGTEAVEAALKAARRFHWKKGEVRERFVATEGGFHGRSMGALSATHKEHFRKGYKPLFDVTHVPFGDLEAMRGVLDEHVAAVIIEPIQGNTGVMIPPEGYLKGLRKLCDESGVLLILDEVQTGMGRTGKLFAYEHEDFTPDMMALAKALGGGLPLGATLMTEEVAQSLEVGAHGTTFGGNPVACAAGLTTLHIIEEEDILGHTKKMGERAIEALNALGQELPIIKEVRGRGLMIGIEIEGSAREALALCRNKGLLATASGENVIRLLPPLIVQESDIDLAISIIGEVLKEL